MWEGIVRRRFLTALPAAGSALQAPRAQRSAAGVFDVAAYGAAGDGIRLDTKAIQAAIDACAQAGGGIVSFSAGRYLSGTILLKSNVTLRLGPGAVLLGSNNLADYPLTVPAFRSYTDNYTDKSLIYAENVENVGLEGSGTIDGQGASFKGPYKVRPYLIRIINSRGITVAGITIRDSPMWVQHYLACDDVNIRGIAVHSRVNANNDGIDIDCCERVRISDCEISSGDDAIVLKSTAARPCRNITISNCVLSSHCNALKMGTETNGGFENIVIANCAIYDTRLAGIALEIVDGGVLDRVNVSGITMNNVGAPIFLRLGDRARPFRQGDPRPAVGRLRNVLISDVQAVGASRVGCAISGLPDHAIERVSLENIRLWFDGGGKPEHAPGQVPEHPERYPEFNMFGVLPAYGLYCRHIRGLRIQNVQAGWDQPDQRPALVCEDVQGLEVFGAGMSATLGGGPSVILHQVRQALIQGCRVPGDVNTWLRVTGRQTGRVSVIGNDLELARKPVDIDVDVPREGVFVDGNRV